MLPAQTTPGHKHEWRGVMHADGCHFYTWAYSCACGASATTRTERDIQGDPYSAVWMDEDGIPEEDRCGRCVELRAGSKPTHSIRIIAKDGTVERDEETTADAA